MDFRFVAYDPQAGAKLYQLPRANSVKIGDTFGTRGTLELTYSAKAVNARDLPTFLEVQAEVTFDEGHNWAPAGPSLLRLSGEHEDTDQAGMRTLRFVGREWVLGKARVGNGDLELIDGKRPFYRASPGQILRTLILEAQDRGAADGIEIGNFTAAKDSSGKAWAKVATIYYSPGLPIGSVLENLVEQGMCDYRMDGRTLHLYDPETTMGRDLTTGDNPVRVHGAVTEAPVKYTLEDLANSALLMGDEGFELEVDNPTAPDDYGRLEVTIEQGGVSDSGTARLMVDEALHRGSREVREITRSQSAAGAAFLPFRDYRVGDYVQVHTGGEWERYRVREIQLARDGQEWTIHAVINDRLQELLLKLAKRTNGIVNGSKGSGGDGTRPTPPEKPGIEPAAPGGLVIDQQVYLDRQGIARGQITAGWGEVTESTKGTAVEIGGYELWWRRNETQAVWTRAAVTDGSITVSHSPVVLTDAFGTAMEYQWRVRAIAEASTRPGPFSDVVTLTMTQDTEPPNTPSLPTVTTDLRIVTVDVDGLDEFGEAMPVDFDHTRIYFAPAEDMVGAEQVGTLTQPGSWNSGSMTPDVPVWVAVSAVDHVGNESAMTPAQSVTPKKLVDDDSIRDELGTIDGKIDDAVADLNEAIENIVVDANGTTTYWMPTAPDETTDPQPKIGDLWFDTSGEGKNKLHRFDGQEWVSAADQRIDDINTAVDELNDAIDNIIIDANGTTTYQTPYEPDETTDPKPKAGDLWFNTSDNMKLSRFDGNQWASAADRRIDTLRTVQEELSTDIDEVRVSANGKSRIIHSDRVPTAEDEGANNDVWWVGEGHLTARNIVMVGDSITEGVGASHTDSRWQTIVQQRLSPEGAKYPFIPAWSLAPTPGFPVVRGGAHKHTDWSYRYGFGWRTAVIYDHSIDGSEPGFVEFTFTGTSAEAVFVSESSTGIAEISVDGGEPFAVDTNRNNYGGVTNYGFTWGTGTLDRGVHTVRVTRSDATTSGDVYIEGLLTFDGDESVGTRLIDAAKAGISTSWWTDDAARLTQLVGTSTLPGAFASLDKIDLVCLLLGTNDVRVGITPVTFRQNYEEFISKARAAGYSGQFLLVGMYLAANRDPNLWVEFHQEMQTLAAADVGVEYLDLRPLVPGPLDIPENYADVSHPNDAGHLVMADAIEGYLQGSLDTAWSVTAQFVHDGTQWNETPLDGQVVANLDAGKIVSGVIDSARIKAGSLSADTVLVPGSAGSTVIRDGAITTEKIRAGAITADSGIVGSLDAGTITVGEMEGARIKAQTVTADKLLVGGSRNLVPNGDLDKGSAVGWPTAASFREQYGPPSGGDTPNVTFPAVSATYSLSGWGPWVVAPGETYVIEAWVRASKAGSSMYMTIMDQDGSRIRGGIAVYEVVEGPPQVNMEGPLAEIPLTTDWVRVVRKFHVPDGVYRVSFQSFILNHSSGTVQDATPMFAGLKFYEPIGATLIEDGAITTEKIAVGAITADSGVVGSLDAGDIKVGELDAARIGAKTVTAEKLLIGGGMNVMADGGFEEPDAWEYNELVTFDTVVKRTGRQSVRLHAVGANAQIANRQTFEAREGEKYVFTAWVYNSPANTPTNGGFRALRIPEGSDIGTGWSGTKNFASTSVSPAGEWTQHSAMWTSDRNGMVSARIAIAAASPEPIWIDDFQVQRQVAGTLIEDGAITTDKILANAITAGKIAALAIEADHISANAITADKIHAGAIDSMLITGARIRTAASGARVELNSEGLKAYRSNGAVVLNTDTSDGSIDMTGRLSQTIGDRTITVGGDYGGGPGIIWSDSNIYVYPPGVRYGNDPGNTSVMTTLVQGPGTNSGNSYLDLVERGDGFDLRAWKGTGSSRTDWRVDAEVGGMFRVGSSMQGAPSVYMKRGATGTGYLRARYEHPSLPGGNSTLSLEHAEIYLSASDSKGDLVSRLWGDADSTELNAGTRNLHLKGNDSYLDANGGDLYVRRRNSAGTETYPYMLLDSTGIHLTPKSRRSTFLHGTIDNKLSDPVLTLVVGNNGEVGVYGSTARIKEQIETVDSTTYEDNLLSVPVSSWIAKRDIARSKELSEFRAENPMCPIPEHLAGAPDVPQRNMGMIAEDMHEAGMTNLVGYDAYGRPDTIIRESVGMMLIPIIRRLRDRVDALETKLGETA